MADNTDSPDFESRLAAMEEKTSTQQATIDKQSETINKQNKTIDGLTKQLKTPAAAAPTDSETEKRLAAMEHKTAAQQTTIDQQTKTILALTKQLKAVSEPEATKEQEIPKIPEGSFTVENQEYKFVVAHFRHKGETMTAIDALNSPEVLAELVDKKSGVIVAVH